MKTKGWRIKPMLPRRPYSMLSSRQKRRILYRNKLNKERLARMIKTDRLKTKTAKTKLRRNRTVNHNSENFSITENNHKQLTNVHKNTPLISDEPTCSQQNVNIDV